MYIKRLKQDLYCVKNEKNKPENYENENALN